MTLDLREYFERLTQGLDARYEATPELSSRQAFHALLDRTTKGKLVVTAEPKTTPLVGRPDFVVKTQSGLSVGYVETKAPGTWGDLDRALESEQLQRYRSHLANVLLTDYVHGILLRNGQEVARAGLLPVLRPGQRQLLRNEDLALFDELLARFLGASPQPITSPARLASVLAAYAAILRTAMEDQLAGEDEKGPLRTLHSYFQRYLQPKAEFVVFADAIAQAVTYALVVARMYLVPGERLSLANAPSLMPESLGFLRAFVKLVEDTDALGTVEWALREICDVLVGVTDGVLRAAGKMSGSVREDTIIYFYEQFLAAYDPESRIDRGVYYTPPPLVDFVVRSVDELLRSDFGLTSGFADSHVTLLDPACGTGTFLVSAAARALDTTAAEDGAALVPSATRDHVLQHFIGFELQPCAYTIAHIKLTAFAAERAPSLLPRLMKDLRPRVYLTNTLSPPDLIKNEPDDASMPIVREVVREGIRANSVKNAERILVIVGNPPYKREAHNKNDFIDGLLKDFFCIDKVPIRDRNTTPLQSDELRFLRWAIWKLIDQENGHGIVAFVINHALLRRRLHRGVRKFLLDRFDEIHVFDLMGNQRAYFSAVQDEKVFPAVQQGVCICIFVRKPAQASRQSPIVRYRRVLGTRDAKFATLDGASIADAQWETHVPTAPLFTFIPPRHACEDYDAWPRVSELFSLSSSGLITGADSVLVDVSRDGLSNRMRRFLGPRADRETIAAELDLDISKPRSWLNVVDKRRRNSRLRPEAIREWTFRPGDRRFVYLAHGILKEYRKKVTDHAVGRTNTVLAVGSGGSDEAAYAWVSDGPMPQAVLSQRTHGRAEIFPAKIYALENLDLFGDRENVSEVLQRKVTQCHGRAPSGEDLIAYVYAVLWSNWWRSRWGQKPFEDDDFPRIPIPQDQPDFVKIANFGSRLVALHTLATITPAPLRLAGSQGEGVIGAWRYDAARQCICLKNDWTLGPITNEDVKFAVGGYEVLRQWFKAREGCSIEVGNLSHLKSLLGAIRGTPVLVQQVDALLEDCARASGFLAWEEERHTPPARATFEPKSTFQQRVARRVGVAARLVNAMHSEPTFGRTKLAKLFYLADQTLNLQLADYVREAAGPLDPRAMYNEKWGIEAVAKTFDYFAATTSTTHEMVRYEPLSAMPEALCLGERWLPSGAAQRIDELATIFRKMNTDQCEIVATLYACWNDLLLRGRDASDQVVIDEFLRNWHERKARFSRLKLEKALEWMRSYDIIPHGTGSRTKPRVR